MKLRNKVNNGFPLKPLSWKQQLLIDFWQDGSPFKNYNYVIADGAIRSGKTVAMIISFLKWSFQYEGKQFIIAGRSVGALKRNVINVMLQILYGWGIKYDYNRSEGAIYVGTNVYYIFGASNEASQDVLQGLSAQGALADEVALFPQNFVEQMIGRCDANDYKIFMNCNPSNPQHFIMKEFIRRQKKKKVLYLKFTMDDNLTLSEERKQKYRDDYSGSGVFYKRYILGEWVNAEGVVYPMFDTDKHVVPTVDRPYTEYYVSSDFGTQNATVFLLWGKYQKKWYLVKEYYHSGRDKQITKTTEDYVDDYIKWIGNIKPKQIIIDPSATPLKAAFNKRGIHNIMNAKNDVIAGILEVQNKLNNNEIAYNDCCKNTIREKQLYSWDQKAAQRGEDIPLKENDHTQDAEKYFVFTILKGPNMVIMDRSILRL